MRPLRRDAQLAFGLVLYTVAIAPLVRAGLGTMPWDVLSQGLSRRLGWTFGTVTLAASAVVLLGWFLGGTAGVATVAYAAAIGPLVHRLLPLFTRTQVDGPKGTPVPSD